MKVSSDTISRTVCLAIALANQILAILGKDKLPILDDDVYQLVSILATVVTAVAAWWKNNSFTMAARYGDRAMEDYRNKEDGGYADLY